MRKTLALALAALLVACFASYSFAYEFEMKGEYEYRFRWWERTGNQDLFGISQAGDSPLAPTLTNGAALTDPLQSNNALPENLGIANNPLGMVPFAGALAASAVTQRVGLAGPNIYGRGWGLGYTAPGNKTAGHVGVNVLSHAGFSQVGIVRGGLSFSASNALCNESRLTLLPTIRVNPAIRLHGVYNVGGYRNRYNLNGTGNGVAPFERYHMSQNTTNGTDTAAIGSWEQFRATINIPWGTLSIGVKDFPFGTGATFANNTRSESFLMVVPYGPLRFLGAVFLGAGRGNNSWGSSPDGAEKPDWNVGGGFTYDDGPLSAGALAIYRGYHQGTQSLLGNLRDDYTQIYTVYSKYFNGRFFANLEYSWLTIDRYRATNANSAVGAGLSFVPGGYLGSSSQTLFFEGYHFFAEAGTVCGPMKLSLMYGLSSGNVNNNQNRLRNWPGGALLAQDMAIVSATLGGVTPATAMIPGNNPKIYTPYAINYQALEPYEYLMFNTYGGGNNGGWCINDVALTTDEHGSMTDAYCFAGRVDYAVASNLNIWASYIWAHRLERTGTYFGQYTSTGTMAGNMVSNLNASQAAFMTAQLPAFYANAGRALNIGADYVSDGFIGWEANGGVDWKLLEGLTFKGRYSYWAPGDYFREAYQAMVLTAGGVVNTAGVLNSRDPIQAFQGSLLVEF